MSNDINNEYKIENSRPYQEELLDRAIDANTIIFLPTGYGKTYIAMRLIKELSHSTGKPYSQGGKRSIFLAPNVPLVIQQAEYLKERLPLKIDCYYGDKIIEEKVADDWTQSIWNKELEHNQILVMTPRVLVEMMNHGYLDLNRVNLIVFDECHNASGLHDYSQILYSLKDFDPEGKKIRILGLTASIALSKCNLSLFNDKFRKLEEKFK